MSKQKKSYDLADFDHVTAATIEKANRVVADRKVRRYSVSAIYKAHNEIFKLREPFQTCDSCLVTRASAVERWLEWYNEATAPVSPAPAPPTIEEIYAKYGVDISKDTEVETLIKWQAANSPVVTKIEAEVLTNHLFALTKAAGIDGDVGGEDHHDEDTVGTDGSTDVPQPVEILLQQVDKDDYSKTKGEALFALFTPSADDVNKGTATNKETGKALAAGTYATTDTTKLLGVQPGGKAAYKPVV